MTEAETSPARSEHPFSTTCPGLDSSAEWDQKGLLRGDIYPAERLNEHAQELARAHGVVSLSVPAGRLRARISAARDRIIEAYATLEQDVRATHHPTPPEEWLLDNSHIVSDQLREIDEDLPWGYLVKLPRLTTGKMRGYPRVYGLCLDYLRHTDARIDPETLAQYVASYQTVSPLAIGELWAVPILLRLGLILTTGALASTEVETLARASGEKREDRLEKSSSAPTAREGLESPRDSEPPRSAEQELRRRYARQAADQVLVGNAITSMRTIAALEWRKFFERTSLVEAILREDPGSVYAATDEASRNRYRHAIEALAERSRVDERGVATAALELAKAAEGDAPASGWTKHVGYYLVDAGRRRLETAVGYRPTLKDYATRALLDRPGVFYAGALVLLFGAFIRAWGTDLARHFVEPSVFVVLLALAALPMSEMAIAFVNALVVTILPPRVLSKFSFREGIPKEHRTLVVVPALVDGEDSLDQLLAHLEVRALANADANLFFGLLTDLRDSDVAERPEDAALIFRAKTGIAELNLRHAGPLGDRFFLFHRRRLWNPVQGVFMGWERKRGKLEELNRLIAGRGDTSFSLVTASEELLGSVRYVITLDADTELPRNTARELVGTMAHPLNRPRWDASGRLVGGYGVIQPRVGTLPGSSRRSRFARMTAGPPGIDPYTTAISDVYQDLFGRGSYIGKGIYDVETFFRALEGRVPENRLLSHDLFEGIFARTALASDIEVLDDQPSSYAVVAARMHRWIRGDFQLTPWLFPRVPALGGATRASDLPLLGWWKLFDNLRRALVAPALVAGSFLGWLSGRQVGALMTATVALTLTAPLYGRLATLLFRRAEQGVPSLVPLVSDLWTSVGQIFLNAVFLLDQSVISVDAMLRTGFRLLVSKRNLLEWQTAGQAERSFAGRLPSRLWLTAALSVGAGLGIAARSPQAFPFALPLLLLWTSAPAWAFFLARPESRTKVASLSDADVRLVRAAAFKTWRFFETFVTEHDHFLPPDNYQEDPLGVVAHRTSPTNIGGYLLSIVSARDFGFLTLREVAERLNATLSTVERLDRREGHVLNWYDTTTLKPLDPPYISTVDSGNLAAYLWTIREACAELVRTPILSEQIFAATLDAVRLSRGKGEKDRTLPAVTALERRLVAMVSVPPPPLGRLRELDEIANAVEGCRAHVKSIEPESAYWIERAGLGVTRAHVEMRELAPWLDRLLVAPEELTTGVIGNRWRKFEASVDSVDSLSGIADVAPRALLELDEIEETLADLGAVSPEGRTRATHYLADLRADFLRSAAACKGVRDAFLALGERAVAIANTMNFSFLYDEERRLLSIGYNAQSERLDGSHYDLLASEARLASFVAIAKGDIREEHWFRLGRSLAGVRSSRALWSWSGSMFEYLMPLLVMKDGDETLLHETYVSVVEAQRKYGAEHGTPWGISESLFNIMDLSMTYQYRAFGVPGLGLKKGLSEDLVIAPYATALAALVRPDLAVENFRALEREGALGRYGYYEAIDYTPSRMPPGRHGVVVKAFMAHHQGMALVAMDNVLFGGCMQRRFHADPRVQATELLLEERAPTTVPAVQLHPTIDPLSTGEEHFEPEVVDRLLLETKAWPRAHLLGHGDVATIVTSVGTGVTMWRGLDVSRFSEDSTRGAGGILFYVRDRKTEETWSIGYEPTRRIPDSYEAAFSADRVEIRRRDGDIEAVLEVVVSPEAPAEVRRVTLTNHGSARRELEVTTYTEMVLATRSADRAHRAFSSLFVQTEALPDRGALVASRKARAPGEAETWAVQVFTAEEGPWGELEYDCSREAFIGRGRDLERPVALDRDARLSRSAGAVLDPAFALRRTISLRGGKSGRIALITALATDRTSAERLIEQYSDSHSIRRTFELGRADARVELRHLGVSPEDGALFQRLLSVLVFPHPKLRVGGALEIAGARGKNALWALGISGDLPILVLRVDDPDFTSIAEELLLAHELFRRNGFPMDLVLLNEEPGGYLHPLQEQLTDLVLASVARGSVDRSGGVFVRRSDQIPEADRTLLLRSAHAVLAVSKGSLSRQIRHGTEGLPLPARSVRPRQAVRDVPAPSTRPALDFDNGIGGFDAHTGEYVMSLAKGKRPSAPWCNVIANANFGFVISEGGATNTWSRSSQGHRLTPWSNDPVCDPSGETLYIRDEEDGSVWSPTPDPAGGASEYSVRHGWGYSRFEHDRSEVGHALTVFVDRERTAKIFRLVLTNRGSRVRKLRIYGVVDWVLGSVRERSFLTIATAWDRAMSAVFAKNPFSTHPERCAFFSSTLPVASFTGDRGEFFGHNGSRARPAAMDRVGLSGRTGAGLDACAALEVSVTLEPGDTLEAGFVLGDAANLAEAQELALRFNEAGAIAQSFEAAKSFWGELLGKVTVRTPDPALDHLLNGWLLYQTTSCRLLGRTAFYQSSGAYGFRDQLQDVMALLHSAPRLAREHILRAAGRQFVEGDVQHWWHPDTGEGVRTRCSDDMLWLPYVTAEYVRATGDHAILDEVISFLDDKPVGDGESEVFGKPAVSTESASLYDHCIRAIAVGTTAGPHGLPRMRGGDWNDGMNRVGGGDGGESVWVAWFLAKTLKDFGVLASARGDLSAKGRFQEELERLSRAVEVAAWDGAWYRRGYFADGTPLGAAQNEECRIDAIAQSWSVIGGVAPIARASLALDQSEALLVRDREKMMSLLWPPFQAGGQDPGYIRAYPPGVRENGGQYTHGVLWTVLARTLLGQGDRASALFSMMNPIHHASSPLAAAAYAVEPYVVAADISASPGRAGRGGWTWYTGAAGWMYRIGLESILGVQLDAGDLLFCPCVPKSFARYEVNYRHGSSTYRIVVDNPAGVCTGVASLEVDGKSVSLSRGARVPLVDDGKDHEVRVTLGAPSAQRAAEGGGGPASAGARGVHGSAALTPAGEDAGTAP